MGKHEESPKGYKGSHRKGGGGLKHPDLKGDTDARRIKDQIDKIESDEENRRR